MTFKTAFVASVLMLGLAQSGFADDNHGRVLYSTGFELFSFFPGDLTGQQGFIAYGDASIDATTVGWGVGHNSLQGVFLNGGKLEFYNGAFEGYYYPSFDYDPLASNTPVIVAQCDVMFVPARTNGPGFGGLNEYDPDGNLYAGMHIDADGHLYYGGMLQYTRSISFNRWYNFKMRLDFVNRVAVYYLNGVQIGQDDFGPGTSTHFGDSDIHMETGQQQTAHRAFFDNYRIVAYTSNSQQDN